MAECMQCAQRTIAKYKNPHGLVHIFFFIYSYIVSSAVYLCSVSIFSYITLPVSLFLSFSPFFLSSSLCSKDRPKNKHPKTATQHQYVLCIISFLLSLHSFSKKITSQSIYLEFVLYCKRTIEPSSSDWATRKKAQKKQISQHWSRK